jgi:Kdo2-lipid IVA lauroyltransferase/acyltransferase
VLPLRWVQLLGRLLGALWFEALPIRRRVALDNLGHAFPELPRRQHRLIAARAFEHVAITVLELFWLGRRHRRALERVISVEGLDEYDRIRGEGRGVVAVTAHLGNWDLLACSQALAGVPLSVVTKELGAPGLSRLWMERRRDAGVTLVPARGSALAILRTLRRGEVVGLIVDQRTPADEGGALIPFFGRPAWTTLAPHVLAARTGAALLPVWSSRRRDGTHVVRIGPEIALEPTPEATMTAINELVERWIRWHPEQWLWHHRRWADAE